MRMHLLSRWMASRLALMCWGVEAGEITMGRRVACAGGVEAEGGRVEAEGVGAELRGVGR